MAGFVPAMSRRRVVPTEPSCHPGFRLVATTQPPSYPEVIGRFIAPFRRQTHDDGLEVVSVIADKINCCHVYGAPDSPARMSASISEQRTIARELVGFAWAIACQVSSAKPPDGLTYQNSQQKAPRHTPDIFTGAQD